MTMQTTYDNFILSRRLAGLAPKSIIDYQQFIMPFIKFVGPDKKFSELKNADINKYLEKLLDKKITRSTLATYIRNLKIYLAWCEEEYEVNYKSKSIKIPRSPKKCVKIYTNDELAQIMSHIHTESEWLTTRNKCIIALMYDSGIRQSEVCTLQKRNISFAEKRMVVMGKGNKERTVPLGRLTEILLQELFRQCPYESEDVFLTRRGEPMTNNAVKIFVNKLSKEVGFELSSHKLRHNFATNYCIDQYEEVGQVDIYRLMILMGHEDIETTRRYLHHANEIIGARGCISHLDKVFPI